MDTKTNKSQTEPRNLVARAVRKLGVGGVAWVLVFIVAVGLLLAFLFDGPYKSDALREIGGALVAGGVIGGVLLLLEELRDDRQNERDTDRHAALIAQNEAHHENEIRAAWQRVLDEALIEKVLGDGRRLQTALWENVDEQSAEPAWTLGFAIRGLCEAGGGREELRQAAEQFQKHQILEGDASDLLDASEAFTDVIEALLMDFRRRGLFEDEALRDSPEE